MGVLRNPGSRRQPTDQVASLIIKLPEALPDREPFISSTDKEPARDERTGFRLGSMGGQGRAERESAYLGVVGSPGARFAAIHFASATRAYAGKGVLLLPTALTNRIHIRGTA